MQSEVLNYNYDEDPTDPRVTHELTLASDDFGNITQRLSLAYPRRIGAAGILSQQQHLHAALFESEQLNFDQPGRFELGIETGQRSFALTGIPAPAGDVHSREALLLHLAVALADKLAFHEEPDGAMPQARLTSWQRNRYWNDAQTAVLDTGQAGGVTLLNRIEKAVYPDAGVAAAFGGRVNAAMLANEARLSLADGYWWASETQYAYAPRSRFCRLKEESSPGGARQTYTFDAHDLLVTSITDVFGNRIASTPDYQVMASAVVTDANGNVSETLYDPLGLTTVTAARGNQIGEDGQAHRSVPIRSFLHHARRVRFRRHRRRPRPFPARREPVRLS